MFLQLRRFPEQERELDQFIDQLHDPTSPNFHHWLTAQDFGQRYGLAAEDLSTISGWLQSHGFAVNVVYPNGILIDFSGTAGQVRNAFHTEIHYLELKGARHIANMRDLQIPASLAPAIVGIVSLNDFRPHPMFTIASLCNPLFPQPTQPSNCYSVAPADLATIYNFNPLFTNGISGQGQTIVVLEPTDVFSTADWNTFRSTFGLSSFTSGSFNQVHPPSSGTNNCIPPGVDPQFEEEAIVDAEWASAGAPSAAIVLASCSMITLPGATFPTFGGLIALQNLLNAPGQPPAVMSISYGSCEVENTFPSNLAFSSAYQQAVAEGVSVFVAAGDESAAGCDASQQFARSGIAVNGFASTQYNVAVGGTDFGDTFADKNRTYWNSTNASNFGSAQSYIPEIPWNNSCASVLIANFLTNSSTTYGSNGFCNISLGTTFFLNDSGGGGGPSIVSSKPSWQSVFGNPSDGVRDLPDVSLFAADGVWGHAYVVCFSDTSNGGSPCTSGAPDTWTLLGGTSVATPIVAGTQALINQKTGSRWGNPNQTYYSLANVEYGASGNAGCNSTLGTGVASTCVFYDVTQGDMDVPCLTNLALILINCYLPSGTYGVLSTSNSAYEPAYGTNTGWDFATGIGTINAANLVNNWPSATVVGGFSLSPNPTSLGIAAPGQSGTSTITVTGTGGFAGTVSFTCSISPVPANDPPTCFANPSSVALSATTTTATANLRISTTAGLSGELQPEKGPNKMGYFGASIGLVLACIFLLATPRPREHWTASLGLVVLALMGVALSSCASGSGGSSQINFGTPTGSYTVTLTASGGGTTQTANVAVTVQ
jgi:subtilase family serine protease